MFAHFFLTPTCGDKFFFQDLLLKTRKRTCVNRIFSKRANLHFTLFGAHAKTFLNLLKPILMFLEQSQFYKVPPVTTLYNAPPSIALASRSHEARRGADETHFQRSYCGSPRTKVLRFAPKTSHQSNGFVEAVHGHIQGLARCYQTQIETNTGIQLSAISPAIPFAVRHAGFVLSRFTVRPDGRTPFQYLLGTPYVSPCACLVNRYSR